MYIFSLCIFYLIFKTIDNVKNNVFKVIRYKEVKDITNHKKQEEVK